jgi:hypothetical protein
LSTEGKEGESGGCCQIYYKKKQKLKLSWNDQKEREVMMSKETGSSDGKLINTNSMQLIRANLFLPALFILKHKIITIDHTGTAVDDGILHNLT